MTTCTPGFAAISRAVIAALMLIGGSTGASAQITTRAAQNIYPKGSAERRFVSVTWDTVTRIESPELDSAFAGAFRIISAPGGYYLYSDRRQRLGFLSDQGVMKWRTPDGTFDFVRDLKAARGGGALLLDGRRGVVVRVGPAGDAAKALEAPGRFEQMAPLADGGAILFNPQLPQLLARSPKSPDTSMEYPWPAMTALDPMQRQSTIAADPDSDRWALGITFGDGWAAYAGTKKLVTAPYIEHVDFPVVITETNGDNTRTHLGRSTLAAIDMKIRRDTLWVLYGGRSESRGRVIDRYSLRTGMYLSSLVLPVAPEAVALAASNLAVLVSEPRPSVLVLRAHETRK